MARSRKLETVQASIKATRDQLSPPTEEAIVTLQQVLTSKQPVAIAQVAKLVLKHHLTQLIPDLAIQFERMLTKGASADPNCIAKKAIANTLYQLEYPETELFLSGIHHIQMEPVWGKSVDTAPGVRAICALGLVRFNYRNVMIELADLLADPEIEARVGAARAVAYSENPQGVPLLRLKLHLGDPEPQVLSECFIALLQLAPQHSFPLVARFLESSDPAICELAAFALGEARIAEAFQVIKQAWQQTRALELRQSFLVAIATLRTDEAIQFLTGLIEKSKLADANDALIALSIYRHTEDIWQIVKAAAQHRNDLDPRLLA
ncbi:MAG: HEAT repeat domain-containing protein [Cyanobacteria bacterium J06635_1]